MKEEKISFFGWTLILVFTAAILLAGFISYKSIDFKVLEKMESQVLVLPTPVVDQVSPQASESSSE